MIARAARVSCAMHHKPHDRDPECFKNQARPENRWAHQENRRARRTGRPTTQSLRTVWKCALRDNEHRFFTGPSSFCRTAESNAPLWKRLPRMPERLLKAETIAQRPKRLLKTAEPQRSREKRANETRGQVIPAWNVLRIYSCHRPVSVRWTSRILTVFQSVQTGRINRRL